MSEKVLATLAAIMSVAAQTPKVGGRAERMELSPDSAIVELTIENTRYTVTITETKGADSG